MTSGTTVRWIHDPSTTTASSSASRLADPSWAMSVAPERHSEGVTSLAWRLLSDYRPAMNVCTIAFGASMFPGLRNDEFSPAMGIRLVPMHTETPVRAPVPLSVPVRTAESPIAPFRNLNAILGTGQLPSFSAKSMELARSALQSLEARKHENIDDWARRIAGDLGVQND